MKWMKQWATHFDSSRSWEHPSRLSCLSGSGLAQQHSPLWLPRPVRPGIVACLICCTLFLGIGAASPVLAGDATPAQAATDQTVATVNGVPIKASELEAHLAVTRLSREDALEDLIDLRLLRSAAIAKQVNPPAEPWSAEVRAGIEYALAQALALDVPPVRISLIVDHAWLKDAEDEKERAAGRALMERLRAMVEAGATIPDAYNKLQVDGALWHIGDHEEYRYEIIPAEAHDLPPGSLSPIIPGDGGLHLFKIYQRREELPPSEDVRGPLLARLRQEATIVRTEVPSPRDQTPPPNPAVNDPDQ